MGCENGVNGAISLRPHIFFSESACPWLVGTPQLSSSRLVGNDDPSRFAVISHFGAPDTPRFVKIWITPLDASVP